MKTRAVRLYGESDLRLEEFDMGELKDDEILMELITDTFQFLLRCVDHLASAQKNPPPKT